MASSWLASPWASVIERAAIGSPSTDHRPEVPGVAAHIAPIQLQLRVAGGTPAGTGRDLALALLPAQHQWLAETEFAQGHLPVHRAVAAPFGELAGDAVGGMGTANHARQDERSGGCKQGRAAGLGHGVTSRGWWTRCCGRRARIREGRTAQGGDDAGAGAAIPVRAGIGVEAGCGGVPTPR